MTLLDLGIFVSILAAIYFIADITLSVIRYRRREVLYKAHQEAVNSLLQTISQIEDKIKTREQVDIDNGLSK